LNEKNRVPIFWKNMKNLEILEKEEIFPFWRMILKIIYFAR